MANIDRQMADRVWKRVQNMPEEPGRDMNLKKLIMDEKMAAGAYLQLARQLGTEEASQLRQMAREEKSHAACMTGMYILTHGNRPEVKMPRQQRQSAQQLLQRAYAGELGSIAAYEALSDHPEYGQVFRSMAQQEREHSRAVLEMLGRLEEKTGGSRK